MWIIRISGVLQCARKLTESYVHACAWLWNRWHAIQMMELHDVESRHPSMESLTAGDAGHLHPGHYNGHRRSPSLRWVWRVDVCIKRENVDDHVWRVRIQGMATPARRWSERRVRDDGAPIRRIIRTWTSDSRTPYRMCWRFRRRSAASSDDTIATIMDTHGLREVTNEPDSTLCVGISSGPNATECGTLGNTHRHTQNTHAQVATIWSMSHTSISIFVSFLFLCVQCVCSFTCDLRVRVCVWLFVESVFVYVLGFRLYKCRADVV